MPLTGFDCESRVSARRKLLFVSPCTPDPLGTGWEQRAYSFLLGYSRFMDVDLWFAPTSDNPDLTRMAPLSALCRSITAFHPLLLSDGRTGLKARLLHHLSSSDLVHVFRFQEFVWNIGHKCIVWDIDELPWSLRQGGGNAGVPPSPNAQVERINEALARCVSKCRMIMGSSRLERPNDCTRFTVIPNVVRSPSNADTETPTESTRLLFVGNLNYLPNTEALAFFRDRVLPDLEAMVPDVRILVVGRSPVTDAARSAIAQFQANRRFEFAFDVPDCAPFYSRSTASIAPIRTGGGTRLKIIESFAHCRPVVSTSKGCEGLDVQDGEHLRIADSAPEFAQACAELLRKTTLRARLADAARRFCEREHSQPVVDGLLESTVARLIEH